MSFNNVLSHWFKTVANAFETLSKPQAFVLAAFSLGMGRARSCTLSRAAEKLFWLGKADTVERRFQRFLANDHLDWKVACQNLAALVLSSLAFGADLVTLLVDETSLSDHLRIMVVSLAYRGRAIPLSWWTYEPKDYPMGQAKLIDSLLSWIAPQLAGRQVLVQADRGIGTSVALLKAIEKRGWYYLVRVQGSVRLRLADGRILRFKDVLSAPGQRWAGEVQAFKKAGWKALWAIAYWGKGHKEPWLLLTNWPELQGKEYGERMWQELGFRDIKSYGWQWQKSRVWEPEHANRLWLVMALAYVWALSLGTQAAHFIELCQEVARGRCRRYSLFTLGLRVLNRIQELYDKIKKRFFNLFEVWLIPEELWPKSVVS